MRSLQRPPMYSEVVNFLQKAVFILICSLHSITFCNAELRDPTRPSFFSAKTAEPEANQTNYLKLSSISISSHSKRATINGVSAKQGENILSDIKIITISKNTVVIEQQGIRKKLYLLTRSYKNRCNYKNCFNE